MNVKFYYRAVMPEGRVTTGSIEAASADDVRESIRSQGLLLLAVSPASQAHGLVTNLLSYDILGGKLSHPELAYCTKQLSVMLRAGQDLDQALHFVAKSSRKDVTRKIFMQIRAAVRNGSSLASALEQHSSSFPFLYVGLVRAAEAGGTLPVIFQRLSDLLERQRALRSVVISSVIYPTFVLITGAATVTFMFDYVFPQLVQAFNDTDTDLPRLTQLVMSVGQGFNSYGAYVGCSLPIAFIVVAQLLSRSSLRHWWDNMLLRLPIMGDLIRELIAARLTRCLGTLLENGVPLVNSLDISCGVVGNRSAVAALQLATEGAKEGSSLSQSLQYSNAFPARMIDLLRLGEETGKLSRLSLFAAETHEEQVGIAFKRLSQLLAPTMLLIVGIIVAVIVSSLLMAFLAVDGLPP
jgi:general secretion pathway protein F